MSRTVGHYAPWLLAVLVGSLIAMTLVPYVAALVPTVDTEAGYVRLSDLPGLLDPDAAETVDT